MMTLVAVAISVAFTYSAATVLGLVGMPFFWELATLIDVMLLGHWIEMRSVGAASAAVESLAQLVPSQAHRKRGEDYEDVPTSSLHTGDIVLIRPGEKVPADGVVMLGASSLDESLLTGESRPVAKGPGDEVIGGSLNGTGALTASVARVGSDSFLAQIAELVREAQTSKSRTQDLADRAAVWLTVAALGGGALTLGAWLAAGRPLAYAVERAVTVMVIACPHALGLAIPLVVAISTTLGARNGLFVRNRMAFENARKVDLVVFDKTGTLTEGHFGVRDVVTLAEQDRTAVLGLAASVEQLSEHPIARAIAGAARPRPNVMQFAAMPGTGARATVDGRTVAVVSPRYLEAADTPVPAEFAELAARGRTVVAVLLDERPIGLIALADAVRDGAADAMARLRALGVEPVMLTGDSEQAAADVAATLGIHRYFAGVTPAGKADIITRLRSEGHTVAMVGDGVNDAPSLAAADVGLAIGAGTDVAVATADVVLLRDDPSDAATVIALARTTYRKMRQNLAWATAYNVIAIPLAAGVLAALGIVLAPAVGGALMAASTVVVAVNARLLRLPEP